MNFYLYLYIFIVNGGKKTVLVNRDAFSAIKEM